MDIISYVKAKKVEQALAQKVTVVTENGFTDGNSIEFEEDKRIHLKTKQKWIESEGHLSDLLRLQWTAERAKPALVWLDELGKDKAAIIAHYKANDPTRIDHRHVSIETTMSPDGAFPDQLYTRLEFPFDADVCEIQTHDSNFTIVEGKVRVMGGDGTYREFQFGRSYSKEDVNNQNPDGTPNYTKVFSPRWSIRADATAEFNTRSGADFKITRFDNAGVALDSPIVIKRDTGFTGLGVSDPQRQLDVAGDRIRIRNTKTPASATDTGLKGDICYDANYVYICVADNTWKRSALSAW